MNYKTIYAERMRREARGALIYAAYLRHMGFIQSARRYVECARAYLADSKR